MNEILIMALANRIKAEPEQMTIEQVPEPYREEVEKKLNDV
jgi:hypothetical protein